jgi:hypothetical protein
MSVLKYFTSSGTWVDIYESLVNAINNRLRCDMNLGDVPNKATARANLELNGNNNTTHYHDQRYAQSSALASETTARTNADNALSSRINNLTSTLNLSAYALKTDLEAYAPKSSPTLTGVPKAPTATASANSTQIATTAFVKSQNYAPLASPGLSGKPTAPTAAVGTNNSQIATTAYVKAEIASVLAKSNDKLPIGVILPYVGSVSNIPAGWHLCDGTGGTPNLTGKFLEGVASASSAKVSKEAGLPNIKGSFGAQDDYDWQGVTGWSGALYKGSVYGSPDGRGSGATDSWSYYGFDASKSNPIYGKSTTVQPSSYTVMYIMKVS